MTQKMDDLTVLSSLLIIVYTATSVGKGIIAETCGL